jgi:hypothetical protein
VSWAKVSRVLRVPSNWIIVLQVRGCCGLGE